MEILSAATPNPVELALLPLAESVPGSRYMDPAALPHRAGLEALARADAAAARPRKPSAD